MVFCLHLQGHSEYEMEIDIDMPIVTGILVILLNCIVYTAFGALICMKKEKRSSLAINMVVGFFLYYALFFIVCLPIMLTYRPLSLLSTVWAGVVAVIVLLALVLKGREIARSLKELYAAIKQNRIISLVIFLLILVQVILVASTYNFTLDAAYYVANVSTSVNTNMINVYDPFTGAWQDHFELRYVFATYSIHDAVICQLTKLPALVQTKTVMAGIVMLLVNLLYVYISNFMCKDNRRQATLMYIMMIVVNLTYITIYTSANFLMTRTYEGKSIVGNIAVVMIFTIYMMAVRDGMDIKAWIMLFIVCVGTATVSSTANMILPAELCILFVPYIFKKKCFKQLINLLICMIPELVMLMIYVLYVKGYFAVYTYPR